MTIYSDYRRDKVGWFFGLSGWQLAALAGAVLPVLGAVQRQAWGAALGLGAGWAALAVLVVVPVRGRSATGWLVAAAAHSVGGIAGWTRFRSRASTGRTADLDDPDLPGVLGGTRIHDGPPQGASMRRVALIQDNATRVWAVTALVEHPGIALSDPAERDRYGAGLAALLDVVCAGELVEEILLTVRTVPDDGAERAHWVQQHRRPDGPALSRRINEDLTRAVGHAAVRTESFVTVVVPETRLGKASRMAGGGFEGRARVLLGAISEVEAQLRGPVGMTAVTWLTSPELAAACRTGFAPGDRAAIVDAGRARALDPDVNDQVPWAQAGPSGADVAPRHYLHDAWASVSCTMSLPAKGAALGALKPVLTPTEPGERRTLLIAFPILNASKASRQASTDDWAADTGAHLRTKLGVKEKAAQRTARARAAGMDSKLATGRALLRPYAVATITVPRTLLASDAGRRLEGSVRKAGFAPLRLDLAQDAAFAATAVPLGVSLTRRSDA